MLCEEVCPTLWEDPLLCSVSSQGVQGCPGTLPVRTHTSHSFPACLHSVTLRRSLSFRLPQAARSLLNHFAPSLLLQGEITHDEFCAACKRGASLQPCSTCSGAYHLSCLDPPLKTAPKGLWVCPKCQRKVWAEGLTPLPCTFSTVFWVIPAWVEQGAYKGVTGVLGTHPWLLQGRQTQKEV